MTEPKRMKLRYAGTCYKCDTSLPAKQEAYYDPSIKKVYCIECPIEVEVVAETAANHSLPAAHTSTVTTPTVPEQELAPAGTESVQSGPPTFVHGEAGAAARLEHERRRAREEAKLREAHPHLGGLFWALNGESSQTKVWEKGAIGEEKLAKRLNAVQGPHLILLHDRRVPKSKANIDHIAVTTEGVWIIDAKRYKGRPERRTKGGLFSPRQEQLWVNGRDQTKLVSGVQRQMALVEDALERALPVHGVLCFIDSDWGLLDSPFTVQGVQVMWPKKLVKVLQQGATRSVYEDPAVKRLLEVFKSYT